MNSKIYFIYNGRFHRHLELSPFCKSTGRLGRMAAFTNCLPSRKQQGPLGLGTGLRERRKKNGNPLLIKVDWPTLARQKAERNQNLILDKGD